MVGAGPRLHVTGDIAPRQQGKRTLVHLEADEKASTPPTKRITREGNDDVNEGTSHVLRGVTRGQVKIGAATDAKWCIVMGDACPSWLFCLPSLGYKVKQVVMKAPVYLESVYALVGNAVQVWSGTAWGEIASKWPFYGPNVKCFYDGRLSKQLLDVISSVGIEDVFSIGRPRRAVDGWSISSTKLEE